MAYELFHEGTDAERDGERVVYLRARTVLTPFVFAEERPRRITDEERRALEDHLEPDDQPRRRTPKLVEPVTSRYDVHVRFSDVDVYGHVNNVKYFEYLQEARVSMLAELVDPASRQRLVVAQTDVDYLAPILFRAETYECRTCVVRLGTRSMTMESDIRDGERVLARARIVVVFYDTDQARSTEPDPELRARLEAAVAR